MHVILEEDLFDKEYIKKHTLGFEQLKEHLKIFSPDKMFKTTGIEASEIREVARLFANTKKGIIENAFDFSGFVPAYIRTLFCEGKGPFRWVALSGDPEDIYKTDKKILELFPEDKALARWIKMAQEQVRHRS